MSLKRDQDRAAASVKLTNLERTLQDALSVMHDVEDRRDALIADATNNPTSFDAQDLVDINTIVTEGCAAITAVIERILTPAE